jgi:hypothetical protein
VTRAPFREAAADTHINIQAFERQKKAALIDENRSDRFLHVSRDTACVIAERPWRWTKSSAAPNSSCKPPSLSGSPPPAHCHNLGWKNRLTRPPRAIRPHSIPIVDRGARRLLVVSLSGGRQADDTSYFSDILSRTFMRTSAALLRLGLICFS